MFKWLYDTCFNCKRKRFFVRKRQVQLPTGHTATSREKFCGQCIGALAAQLKKQEHE